MALSNSQYEVIIKGYQRVRDENRILAESRKQEVYDAIPEYLELSQSISTLSVAGARRMLEGDENALSRLRQELSQVTARQRHLLACHGFPADYLEPVYRCPDCLDTGYILSENGLSPNGIQVQLMEKPLTISSVFPKIFQGGSGIDVKA